MDVGLSSILLIAAPIILVGYLLSMIIILLPFGLGIPLGVGCFVVHTTIITFGLLILVLPRIIARAREKSLRKKMENLPPSERKHIERIELATIALSMGYTPTEDGYPVDFNCEDLSKAGRSKVILNYRDFRRFTGWDHYKGEATVFYSKFRLVIVPDDDEYRPISFFKEVRKDDGDFLSCGFREKNGGMKLRTVSLSKRRLLSRLLPIAFIESSYKRPESSIGIESTVDTIFKDKELVTEIRHQKDILDVWIR